MAAAGGIVNPRPASRHLRLILSACGGTERQAAQRAYRAAAEYLEDRGLLAAPPADPSVLRAMLCDPDTREIAQSIAAAWLVSV